MKNAILVAATKKNGTIYGIKNMGDYIQSLAGEMFFDVIDEYIDREKLADYKSESGRVKMIMNAWYMWNPEKWPPSDDILPLLISMHFSPVNSSRLLSFDGINYLKKYGPVGCRDRATEKLLNQYGIPCYFSGCLTLTLGNKYKTKNKKNTIIFVDPLYDSIYNIKGNLSIKNIFKCLYFGIIYFNKVKRLMKTFQHSNFSANRIKLLKIILSFLNISAFYKTYSSYFDDQLLFNAEYITHKIRIKKNTALALESEKMNYAKKLLQKYAEASLVITSRLHCALPCLGVETPVLFVTGEQLEDKATSVRKNRFDGLIELLHTIQYKNFSLTTENNTIRKNVSFDTVITNKEDHISIRDDLIKRCCEFTSNNS